MSIQYQRDAGVATLTFDRPARKNALTIAMYEDLNRHFAEAAADDGVHALVLTGAPGAFTAGNDLKDFLDNPPSGPDAPVLRFMHAVAGFEKPLIAAVNGLAVGIGVTLLLHCDFAYVAEDARLSLPFVNLGVVPELGSTLLLPAIAGRVRAAEKLLLGRPFTAAEAVAMGIANAALPADRVLPQALETAQAFDALPPDAVRATKRLLREPLRAATDEAIAREAEQFLVRLRGPEAREAMSAVLEKRPPDFSRVR